jgi:hypothetical protein
MNLKKLSVMSLLFPLLMASASQAKEHVDPKLKVFQDWLKDSQKLELSGVPDSSNYQGTCEGKKFEISFQSYGDFFKLRLGDQDYILDETNLDFPDTPDEIDRVFIARHGNKLAFVTGSNLMYITMSKDKQLIRLQILDGSKTQDLEGPFKATCLLSTVKDEAVSNNNGAKPQEPQTAAPQPAEEPAAPLPPPPPAPVPHTGSAE